MISIKIEHLIEKSIPNITVSTPILVLGVTIWSLKDYYTNLVLQW